MKLWRPKFRAIIAILLGALLLAIAVLWVRSHRHQDVLRWRTHTASNYRVYTLCSERGGLAIDRSDFQPYPPDVAGEYGFEFFTDPVQSAAPPAWRAWFEFAAGSATAADKASWNRAGFAGGYCRNSPTSSAVAEVWFGVVPFWFVALLIGLIPLRSAWLRLRTARRRRLKLCPACAYNLTGNTSGVCPECGAKVAAGA